MTEKKNVKDAEKGRFFINIKSEFNKIVWPSRQSLLKQTMTVTVTSLALGFVVFVYDAFFTALLKLIVG